MFPISAKAAAHKAAEVGPGHLTVSNVAVTRVYCCVCIAPNQTLNLFLR